MSFVTQFELLVFLRNFRNVDLFQQGLYRIRLSMPKYSPYILLDQLGIKKQKKHRESNLLGQDIQENYFYSRQFWIRFEEEEVNLQEGCIFRIDHPTFAQSFSIELQVDLFFCESKTINQQAQSEEIVLKQIASQTYVIQSIKQMNQNYLPMSFDPNTACVINSLILSLPLNIKYKHKIGDLTLKQYLQKYKIKGKLDLLQLRTLDYLEQILKTIIMAYKDFLAEFVKEPSSFTYYLSQLSQLGPIEFDNHDLETQINSIGKQLTIIWQLYIDVVLKSPSKLMKKLKFQYIQQLQDFYSDFVVKSTNSQEFNKMIFNQKFIDQLRNLDQRILKNIPITSSDLLDNLTINMKYSENKKQNQQLKQDPESKHLIVFVHGYKGQPFDLRRWKNIIKTYYPKVFVLMSEVNQRQGEESIRVMGHKLSVEIQNHIQLMEGLDEISFICHSIGGVVARSALTNLSALANKMKFFISLGSPHIGLFVKQGTLVRTGLWFMTNLFQSQSMVELQLQDAQQIENSYLYYLSTVQSLEWFQKVILVGSTQDDFVPYEVARIEPSTRVPSDKQSIYNKMLNNIRLPHCTRIEVNFTFDENESSWDTFIGRTAHMSLVENVTMIRMIVTQTQFLDH